MDRAQPFSFLWLRMSSLSFFLSLFFSPCSIVTLSLQQETRYVSYLSLLNFLQDSIAFNLRNLCLCDFWWILGYFVWKFPNPLLRIIKFLEKIVYLVGFETCMVGFSFFFNGIWNYWHGWFSYSLIYNVLDIVIIRIMILLLECPMWFIMSLLPL